MLTLGRRLNPRWDDRAARDRLVELGIPMDQKLRRLSVGHQAQVAMALCLGKSPDLLLLDEPAANLDPLARQQLLSSLMERVEAHRTTVVLSSHIIGELESVCDYLIILSGSRVRFADTVESVLSEHWTLVGSRGSSPPAEGLEVISRREAGRQITLTVRGSSRPGRARAGRCSAPSSTRSCVLTSPIPRSPQQPSPTSRTRPSRRSAHDLAHLAPSAQAAAALRRADRRFVHLDVGRGPRLRNPGYAGLRL